MSSMPSIVPDVSAMPASPPARPQTSTGGQQTASQPFADFLNARGAQPPPAASANPNSPANSSDANAPVTAKSDTSSGASSSGAASGHGTAATGSGVATAKGTGANTSTAAGRKLKFAIDRAVAANAAHAQNQPVADPSALAPDPSDGSSQPPNVNDSSTQRDSSAAVDSGLQSLVNEVVDALNRTAAAGGAPDPGDKTVAGQFGKPTDKPGKNDDSTDPTTATSANTGTDQAQATVDQPAATTQPAVANAAQPVAAVLVVNAAADSPSPANARDASSRSNVVMISAGESNAPPAQGAKDAAGPAALPATPAAGLTPQTNSAKTESSSASAGQAGAPQNSNSVSSSDPANPAPADSSSANNTAQQPQGQPQPASAPATAFTVVTASLQSGGPRTGQVSNDTATASAAGSAAGAAANGAATSSILANLGTQAANATNAPPPAVPMPLASAVAIPIAGLAVEIAARARGGSNKFDIRLDPPELGRIDVRLDVDRNGQVSSHVTVDRPDTLQLLQSQQPQLQRALEQAGLTTTNNGLQFTLRDQSFAGQNGGGGNGSGGSPPVPQLVIPDAKLAAIDTAQIYSRWNFGGGLDIRV